MLLNVGNSRRIKILIICGIASLLLAGAMMTHALQAPSQPQQSAAGTPPQAPTPTGQSAGTPGSPSSAQASQSGLNIVVLDPAHGGTDLGARGTGGIQESEIVMEFAAA